MPDYEIGYKKPPRANRFKAGKSGNPKGRPKRYQSMKDDLIEELQETVTITENGKTRKLSKQRIMIKRVMAKALNGDLHNARLLVNMLQKHLPQESSEVDNVTDMLPQEDEELLSFYIKTRADS